MRYISEGKRLHNTQSALWPLSAAEVSSKHTGKITKVGKLEEMSYFMILCQKK
jgi:hypothetical protein